MIRNIYLSLGIILFTAIQVKAQICQDDIPVTNSIITGSQLIEANNSITATGTNLITNTATVEYRANFEITLGPDFDVNLGANFDGYIGECEGTTYNDPYSMYQWGHINTGNVPLYVKGDSIVNRPLGGSPMADARIYEAWELIKNPSEITVAILDSGIDIGHPDLYDPNPNLIRIVEGQNFLEGGSPSNFQDFCGHGTLVSGILGAISNNGIGIAGVNNNCKIMPLKVVDNSCEPVKTSIKNAISYAIDPIRNYPANIMTMSFGGSTLENGETIFDLETERAFGDAIDAGVLLFAAAGNDNGFAMDYPAKYPSIIGVGALSPCDERKSSTTDNDGGSCDQDDRDDGGNWGSNYGEGLDFLAPGTLLPSTDLRGSAGYSSFTYPGSDPTILYQSVENGDYILDAYGTSMSSPFAAGIGALIWSTNPSLKNYQVRYIMQQTARDETPSESDDWDPERGYGALDAKAAVLMAQTFVDTDFLLPNLTLEIISLPDIVVLGESSIKFRVKNIGDTQANASTLSYTSGRSNNINETIIIDPLNAQESSVEYTIPISVENCYKSGDIGTITFEIDKTEDVTEYNEFNTFQYSFQIIGMPDYIVDSTTFSSPSKTEVKVDIVAKNIGNTGDGFKSLGGVTELFKIYGSLDIVYDEGTDIDLGIISGANLSECPNELTTREYSKTFAIDEFKEFNFLIIEVDSANLIDESNENNNVFPVDITQFNTSTSTKNLVGDDGLNSPIDIRLIPNPITNSGIIKYDLEYDSTVSIYLYDITGYNPKMILAETKQNKGNYEIPIYRSNLKTGVYIVEVIVNGLRSYENLLIK